MPHAKKMWADPNREGKSQDRQGQRYCARCGNTVQQARILKNMNLCEFCVKELEARRDGIHSCRGCGQIVVNPDELRQNKGYCKQCVCPACGRPDPQQVRKTGLCFPCSQTIGDFCRVCGKEAAAQVRKNRGFCDSCVGQRTATVKTRRQPSGRSNDGKFITSSTAVKPRRQPLGKLDDGKFITSSTTVKPRRKPLGKSGDGKFMTSFTGVKPRRQPGKSAGLQRKK